MDIKNRSLLLWAAEGNNQAVRKLWEIWSPRLGLYFRGSFPYEDAEDLVQETMLKVFHSAGSYNPVYSPSTWIYTIAARSKTDWLRRNSRRPYIIRETQGENSIDELAGDFPDPETEAIRNESQQMIKDFISSREERDREILYLYCYENLSGRGIAKVMNLPPETVRYRLKILKNQLRKELSK